MKQLNKKPFINTILSLLFPFIIILVALASIKIAPFGDKTLLIADADGLYVNYLSFAGRMFKGLEGIVYSFEKGLGGNMMQHLGGTLLNPFYLLFSFTDIINYPIAYTFVSVLNLCLCGMTMYLLLADIYGHKFSNLIFSTSFALIGFNVANNFQVLFFTGVQTLPLMVLGLRKIYQKKSPLLYILSIAYSLLTAFYFGFTLCVASVLFFFVELWLDKDDLKGQKTSIFANYTISSLFGGFISIIIWLPAFLGLQGGRLEQTSIVNYSFAEKTSFIEIGSKLFSGANTTGELVNGHPNIFVGILPIALVILFFINKEVDKHKKIAAGFLLGFYLLSFYIIAFDMLMHGGTNTNWFNFRYSYIFSFILLLVAAYEWQYIETIKFIEIKHCFVIMLVSTIVIFSKKYDYVIGGEVVLDYAILCLIFLAYYMYRKNPAKNPKKTFEIIVVILVSLQLMLNYEFSTKNILDWGITQSEYYNTVFDVSVLVDAAKESDDSFYRMEIAEQRSGNCGNDPMLYGYNGVGHGGSNERNFVRKELSKLGVQWFDMRNYYSKGIPSATDTLLGLKYIIAKEDLAAEKGYELLVTIEDKKLYKNPIALNVAFITDSDISGVNTEYTDVFENLNNTWSALSGSSLNIFEEENDIVFKSFNQISENEINTEDARDYAEKFDASISAMVSDSNSSDVGDSVSEVTDEPPENSSYIEYSWIARKDGPIYSYNCFGLSERRGSDTSVLKFEGNYNAGERVTGYIPVDANYVAETYFNNVAGRFRAAYANNDVLAELSREVQRQPVTINKIKDSHLTGTFTVDTGKQLMFTIPYDEGWTIYVDGEKAEIQKVLGVFMAVDVTPGEHNFEMIFVPRGFTLGKIVSCSSAVLLVVYLLLRNKLSALLIRKKPEETEVISEPEIEVETA